MALCTGDTFRPSLNFEMRESPCWATARVRISLSSDFIFWGGFWKFVSQISPSRGAGWLKGWDLVGGWMPSVAEPWEGGHIEESEGSRNDQRRTSDAQKNMIAILWALKHRQHAASTIHVCHLDTTRNWAVNPGRLEAKCILGPVPKPVSKDNQEIT